MFRPEPLDIVLIVIVALLIFGPKRIPETAHAVGKAIREFKDALAGKEDRNGKQEPTLAETSPKDSEKI